MICIPGFGKGLYKTLLKALNTAVLVLDRQEYNGYNVAGWWRFPTARHSL